MGVNYPNLQIHHGKCIKVWNKCFQAWNLCFLSLFCFYKTKASNESKSRVISGSEASKKNKTKAIFIQRAKNGHKASKCSLWTWRIPRRCCFCCSVHRRFAQAPWWKEIFIGWVQTSSTRAVLMLLFNCCSVCTLYRHPDGIRTVFVIRKVWTGSRKV